MATCKYVSDVKIIHNNQELIYNFLSNFENLAKFFNEEAMEKIAEQAPKKFKLKDFKADQDTCTFVVEGFGETGLRIIEREEPKSIKITGNGTVPFEFYFWVQLLPVDTYQTKLRLTLHAELNMMMKMMLGKKLEEGINQVAEGFTKIPFHLLAQQ
ncbi:hypothetical protein EMN47_15115 [Prolixibacteraceae bacterium JC049]|nr:hypothetical protein [Prolixibacteraceae bacterium JC049]